MATSLVYAAPSQVVMDCYAGTERMPQQAEWIMDEWTRLLDSTQVQRARQARHKAAEALAEFSPGRLTTIDCQVRYPKSRRTELHKRTRLQPYRLALDGAR